MLALYLVMLAAFLIDVHNDILHNHTAKVR